MNINPESIALSAADTNRVAGILARFADRIDIVSIFGSRAADTSRSASDIDLLLDGPIDFHEILQLAVAMEESDLPMTVDLMHERDLTDSRVRGEIHGRARRLFTGTHLRELSRKMTHPAHVAHYAD